MERVNPYDQVAYDSYPCSESHPDGLAAIAGLFGLRPNPVGSCRVLELGCGTGANLVPMAAALPGACFVGIDLSGAQVEAGRKDVAALGLANVTLEQADIAALPKDLGTFDFVLAHGVFSWVPHEVQEALLRVARGCLDAQGVAFVSYSVLPGAYPRQALRDMLAFASRGEAEPLARVARARRFAELAAVHLSDRAPNASALRRLIGQLGGMSDAYVLHDYLSEVHAPTTLAAFVARAAAHRLQYLGDAQFHSMFPKELEEDAVAAIRAQAGDQVAFEQLVDFLSPRTFRTSLLCRSESAVDRNLSWKRLEDLFLTTRAQPRGQEEGNWLFRAPGGEVFGTSEPLVAAALRHLAQEHPRPVPFRELCDSARGAIDGGKADAEDAQNVGINLLAAFASGEVSLGTWDRGVCNRAGGGAPRAFSYALLQAARKSATVTNLWHRAVTLDAAQMAVLPLLDGTRERPALLEQLARSRLGVDAVWLEAQLSAIAQNALLVS